MDGMIALILVLASLLALDFAAGTAGADSREPMLDDHQR